MKWTFTVTVALVLNLCSWSLFAQNSGNSEDFVSQSISEIEQGITEKHPVSFLILALKLMEDKKYDSAARWYYIGQIRYRAHLEANPDLDPSGDSALYGSLRQVVGQPVNEQAASNVDNWVRIIDESLKWHLANENRFTPKDKYPEIYSEILSGIGKFRSYVANNKEEIRRQRTNNGLPNY